MTRREDEPTLPFGGAAIMTSPAIPILTAAGITQFNLRIADLIKEHISTEGLLPESIIGRMSRDRRYACGFTGFKAGMDLYRHGHEDTDDLIMQRDGLCGQWLVAIACTKAWAEQKVPTPQERIEAGWRYYVAVVPPGGDARRYNLGDFFDLPPVEVRQRVITMTNHELIEILRTGAENVCKVVMEGEKDR